MRLQPLPAQHCQEHQCSLPQSTLSPVNRPPALWPTVLHGSTSHTPQVPIYSISQTLSMFAPREARVRVLSYLESLGFSHRCSLE